MGDDGWRPKGAQKDKKVTSSHGFGGPRGEKKKEDPLNFARCWRPGEAAGGKGGEEKEGEKQQNKEVK